MDRIDILNSFYAGIDEDSRLTSRTGSLEFLTTVKYVEKYLKSGDTILEIGAGTGRYSHYFANNGYEVDAIELTDHNIEVFKSHINEKEKITITKGDAINLTGVESDKYDITLLLGPMYHLYNEKDKLSALGEALRVTKRGGVIFVAYTLADAVIIHYGFGRNELKDFIDRDLYNTDTFTFKSVAEEIFELYRREDIFSLMSHFDVTRLHYVGTDMVTQYMRDVINAMSEEEFELYKKYHFFICEREDLVGIANHSLDIFKKN